MGEERIHGRPAFWLACQALPGGDEEATSESEMTGREGSSFTEAMKDSEKGTYL